MRPQFQTKRCRTIVQKEKKKNLYEMKPLLWRRPPRCLPANQAAEAWLLIKMWILMRSREEDFWTSCLSSPPPTSPPPLAAPPGQLWNATVETEMVCPVRLLLVLLQRWACEEFAWPARPSTAGSDQINLFGVSSLSLPLSSLYPSDFSPPISLSVLLLRVIHAGVAVAPASSPSLITLNNRCATCHLVPRRLPFSQESPSNYVSLCFPRCPLISGHL